MRIERRELGEHYKYVVWNDYGTQIVGRAILRHETEFLFLKDINIQRNLRGRGLGSELLERIYRDFEGSEIIANIFEDRLDWYNRHGFEFDDKKGQLIRVRRTV